VTHDAPDHEAMREAMVQHQLAARDIHSGAVLDAMRRVRREAFVPSELSERAYEDAPLPIAAGQTISQPYVVAWMVQALELEAGDRVLEVGTGSGYAAAVLAKLAAEVYTVERIASLYEETAQRLEREGHGNVHLRCADGSLGWPEAAPFDAILVSAGAPAIPRTLEAQLVVGGRLVVPVGDVGDQTLMRIRRLDAQRFERTALGSVRFVPLVGSEGWSG
jgi:protein-L-isoaspartate(D-aspartate) O-methyltransferase